MEVGLASHCREPAAGGCFPTADRHPWLSFKNVLIEKDPGFNHTNLQKRELCHLTEQEALQTSPYSTYNTALHLPVVGRLMI
jgi:hypothetical protein